MLGKLMKWILLAPRVKRATWEQLCSAATVLREKFELLMGGVNEGGSAVEMAGIGNIRDIVANLAAENRRTAIILTSIRQKSPLPTRLPDADLGAMVRTFAEVATDYGDSWQWLSEAAITPILDARTVDHKLFGALNAKEWLAMIGYNLEFAMRNVEKIMRTEDYRKTQGANW